MQTETAIHQQAEQETYTFILGFAEPSGDLHELMEYLAQRLDGDGLLWIAYPKKSSKAYKSDINRDSEAWHVF